MRVQHGINSFKQPRPVPDIRSANVNLVGKSRRAAEKSEFILHIVNSGTNVEIGVWSENPWLSILASLTGLPPGGVIGMHAHPISDFIAFRQWNCL
jgi:hypothetical protein